jgi:hypothetical protein
LQSARKTATFRAMRRGQTFILDGGERYYCVYAAAKFVGVSNTAMWKWAAKGVTSFGFELGVIRSPPREWHQKAPRRRPVDFRRLIPESKLMILKHVLHDFPLNVGGSLSEYERDTLRRAAVLYSARQKAGDPHP